MEQAEEARANECDAKKKQNNHSPRPKQGISKYKKAANAKKKTANMKKTANRKKPNACTEGSSHESSSDSEEEAEKPELTVAICWAAFSEVIRTKLNKSTRRGGSPISDVVKDRLSESTVGNLEDSETDPEVIQTCHDAVEKLKTNIKEVSTIMKTVRINFIKYNKRKDLKVPNDANGYPKHYIPPTVLGGTRNPIMVPYRTSFGFLNRDQFSEICCASI